MLPPQALVYQPFQVSCAISNIGVLLWYLRLSVGKFLKMSDIPPQSFMPHPKPQRRPVCTDCGDHLEWQTVSSSKNNNRGRWYARCPKSACTYYRWGSPGNTPNTSPTNSPPLPSLPPQASDSIAPTYPGLPARKVGGTRRQCASPGCTFSRISPGCENARCRRHCMTLGGCKSKKHRPTAAELERGVTIPGPQAASSSVAPVVDPSLLVFSSEGLSEPEAAWSAQDLQSAMESDCPSDAVVLVPVPGTGSSCPRPTTKAKGKQRALPDAEVNAHLSNEIDAHANPRYPSQMPAVFTERYADQERARQVQAKDSEARRDLEQRARNTVEAYGWAKDGDNALMCEFQESVTLPQFKLSAHVLQALGLRAGNDGKMFVQYFNTTRSRWSQVCQGHILTLSTSQVYLRNTDVSHMPDFDGVLQSYSQATTPHIRNNLKAERAAVRQARSEARLLSLSPIEITDTESGSCEDEGKHKHSGHLKSVQRWSSTSIQRLHRQRSSSLIEISSDSDSDEHVHVTPRPIRVESHSSSSTHNDSSSEPPESFGHSPGSSTDEVDAFEEIKPRWPSSFYACNIADGFAVYDKARRAGLGAQAAFTHAFGPDVQYRSSTFSEQRQRWLSAPPSARAKFVAAGCTDEGRYSLFMSQYPAPRAALKAAQKRIARQGAVNGSKGISKQGPSRRY